MASPEKNAAFRIQGADGIRALACLCVFWHHTAIHLDPQETLWSELIHTQGWDAVAVFFVLSGMLLTLPFWQAAVGTRPVPTLGKYLVARLGRIIPAYYVCLFMTWALFPAGADRLWRLFAGLTCTNWTHWKTFFPAPHNTALWSIGVEVAFYLLLPLWAWGLMRTGGRKWGAAYWMATQLLIAAVQILFLSKLRVDATMAHSTDPDQFGALEFMDYRNPLGLFSHFLFGGATAGLLAVWPVQPLTSSPPARWLNRYDLLSVLFLAGLGVIVASSLLPDPLPRWVNRAQIWTMHYRWPVLPALVAGLLFSLHFSQTIGKWFDNSLLRGVCLISYGIYLWHMVVLELVIPRWPWSTTTLASQIACGGACLLATSLIATVSFYLIELPCMNWLKSKRPASQAAAPQTIATWPAGVAMEAAKS